MMSVVILYIILAIPMIISDYASIYRHQVEYFTPSPANNGHAKPAQRLSSKEVTTHEDIIEHKVIKVVKLIPVWK